MKVIANNKRASFDYFISDNLEVGIVLEGSEVKSIRAGGININESFIEIRAGEVLLKNAYIKQFEKAAAFVPDTRRTRKLLLNKSEIVKLEQKVKTKGFTILPLKVYFAKGLVKLEIGLGKGKKLYDKRECLKEKAVKLDVERAIKNIK